MAKITRRPPAAPKEPTVYAHLGVYPGDDQATIHAAWRNLAQKHHPDRGGNANEAARINLAYGRIKSTELRTQYDLELELLGRLNCVECQGNGFYMRGLGRRRIKTVCPICGGSGEVL